MSGERGKQLIPTAAESAAIQGWLVSARNRHLPAMGF
jgi:hypothetical protein